MKSNERTNQGFYKKLTEEEILDLPKMSFEFVKLSPPDGKVVFIATVMFLTMKIELEFTDGDMYSLATYYKLDTNFKKKFRMELHTECTKGKINSPGKPYNGREYYKIAAFTNPKTKTHVKAFINEEAKREWIKAVPLVDNQFLVRN